MIIHFYLHSQLQELRGNIRVFARCRRDDSCTHASLTFPNEEDVFVVDPKGHKRHFTFDRVYNPNSTQQEVCMCVYSSVAADECCSQLILQYKMYQYKALFKD